MPAVPKETDLDSLGRSLTGSIQAVASGVNAAQSIQQLDSMLARSDEAIAALTAQLAASRASPAPMGVQTIASMVNDTVTGRE